MSCKFSYFRFPINVYSDRLFFDIPFFQERIFNASLYIVFKGFGFVFFAYRFQKISCIIYFFYRKFKNSPKTGYYYFDNYNSRCAPLTTTISNYNYCLRFRNCFNSKEISMKSSQDLEGGRCPSLECFGFFHRYFFRVEVVSIACDFETTSNSKEISMKESEALERGATQLLQGLGKFS